VIEGSLKSKLNNVNVKFLNTQLLSIYEKIAHRKALRVFPFT